MLNQNQLNEIKEKLQYGEEVTITCETITRKEQVKKQFEGLSEKLQVKVII